MKKAVMRRISQCFKCKELGRSLQMHKVYYSGKMDINGREIDVVDEEVQLCDCCFVKVGYYLKRTDEQLLLDDGEDPGGDYPVFGDKPKGRLI